MPGMDSFTYEIAKTPRDWIMGNEWQGAYETCSIIKEDMSDDWACNSCTYLNKSHKTICDMSSLLESLVSTTSVKDPDLDWTDNDRDFDVSPYLISR